jgi:hypothetical protein
MVRVSYTGPTGAIEELDTMTPWTAGPFSFDEGTSVVLTVETLEGSPTTAYLNCGVAYSDGDLEFEPMQGNPGDRTCSLRATVIK